MCVFAKKGDKKKDGWDVKVEKANRPTSRKCWKDFKPGGQSALGFITHCVKIRLDDFLALSAIYSSNWWFVDHPCQYQLILSFTDYSKGVLELRYNCQEDPLPSCSKEEYYGWWNIDGSLSNHVTYKPWQSLSLQLVQ